MRRDDEAGVDLPYRVDVGSKRQKARRRWVLSLDAPEAKVKVEIQPELTPVVGGASLAKPVALLLDAEDRPDLEISEARTKQVRGRLSVVLPTTRRLSDRVPANAVRVEPAVGHRARTDGRTLVLEGDFRPGNEYRINVDALEAKDGRTLASAFETTLTLPAVAPELHIRRVDPVLSPTDVDPIIVQSVQVNALRARTFSVPVDNLVHVLEDLDRPALPRWPSVGRWTRAFSFAVNGTEGTAVRLPDERRPGLRLLEVRAEDQPWLADYRWIQAGWAVTAKQGVRRVRVQVLTAADRRPVRGVQIRLRTRANQPIGPMLTDASGVAEVRHQADDPVELVVATRQGETAILDLTTTASRREAGPLHAGEGVEAFILPSQDRFRRGDKLPILLVSRATGLTPVANGKELQVLLRGPDGRRWAAEKVQLWRSGGARLDFEWPTNATNGLHTIEAIADGEVIGQAKVRLQDQQALVGDAPTLPAVDTSTDSTRLSWTPERPRPGEALQVRWLSPGPGWVTASLEGTDVVAEVRRRVGQGPSTFSLTVPQAAKPGAHLVVTFEPTIRDAAAISDQAYVEVGRRRPLRVRLDLPPGPHRSGSEVVAAVRVRGAPSGAHVVVRVSAPEALDPSLAEERDLFRFFHRYRPPSWHTHLRAGRFKQTPIVPVAVPAPQPAAVLASSGAFMTDAARVSKKGIRKVPLTLPD
ncbi:MAG: hypothetical protein AAFV29_07675, partial [Myxococcota bacterium]